MRSRVNIASVITMAIAAGGGGEEEEVDEKVDEEGGVTGFPLFNGPHLLVIGTCLM